MYQLYEYKPEYNGHIQQNYNTSINLNTLKQSNFKIGNVNTVGFELSVTNDPTSLDNVYYDKPYPTANIYNLKTNNITYKYKVSYKFNPYNYINNGFILYYKNQLKNPVIDGFTNGMTLKVNDINYLIGGIKLTLQNSTEYQQNHTINSAGGTYNIDPLANNYLDMNYNISEYKPIYNILTRSGKSYIYDPLHMDRPKIFTEPSNTGEINQFGNYFVDYKNRTQDIYIGWYQGEYYEDNNTTTERHSLNYIPSLQTFYGYNNVDYNLQVYTPYVTAVYNNEVYYTQTLIKHLNTSQYTNETFINDLNNSNLGFLSQVYDNHGRIPENYANDIGLNYLAEIKEDYTIKNYVEYSAYSTNSNYTYNYVKVFTDNIKQNSKPLYSKFQVENTLYINDLNQINIVASGFNLTDLNILRTDTNSTIAETFNGVMSLELGGTTLTIATIVSAVFLFKGIIALFRSNK